MTIDHKKEFDAVNWVRHQRDVMYEQQKDWTKEARIAFFNAATKPQTKQAAIASPLPMSNHKPVAWFSSNV